ncbi:primase-helicase family protein [Methylocystis iwaonis]|uniref:primase-helicase family protein n=1 Tax=Methylocystis iwaonis TaxID=2885079 RepID=UPI002E7AE612|nr:primase-helicase family protein [Methylocystis iwaonis]
MGKDDIVQAVEGAEILAFPGARKAALAGSDAAAAPGDVQAGGGDAEPPESDAPPPEDGDEGPRDFIEKFNREWCFVLMGSRAVVIREMPDAPIEDRTRVLSVDAFKAYFQNQFRPVLKRERQEDGSYQTVRRYVSVAPYWLKHARRRTYDGIEFFPDPNNAPGTKGYFNLWRGFSVSPDRETPAKERWKKYFTFQDHVKANICDSDYQIYRWVWHWFAHLIQRPRERIGTAIVLRGKMGTGKTVVGDVIGSLFASHYFLVDDPRYLVGQFNAHMGSCILLQVDEGIWAGDKAAEGRLKGLVTAPKQMIEAKGVDPIRLDNYVRLLFSSNESWVVPAGMDERRFACFDVADHWKEDHGRFAKLYAELNDGGREALLADLLEVDLDAPDAPNLRVIPKTGALLEQKIRSLDPIAAWWLQRLEDGAQTHRAGAWREKVPAATLFNDYLRTNEKIGVRRKASETEFGIALRRLVPGVERVRSVEEVEVWDEETLKHMQVMRRVWCLRFPSLGQCKRSFDAALKQAFPWGEAVPEEEAELDAN